MKRFIAVVNVDDSYEGHLEDAEIWTEVALERGMRHGVDVAAYSNFNDLEADFRRGEGVFKKVADDLK